MTRALAFFGAFNPPTTAHLRLAAFALSETGFETAVFVPSKAVYIRGEQGKDYAYGDERRLDMLKTAARTRPWMRVTDWELRQSAQPRSYDTLCHLRETGVHAALLLGSDKLPELEHGWRHVEDIARQFGIVCLARGEDDAGRIIRESAFLSALAPFIRVLETPPDTRGVSSSAVRARMAQIRRLQAEISAMVPEEILPLL